MRPIILIILFFLLPIVVLGQVVSKADLNYKPKNLDDAISHLEKIHDDTTKKHILAMTEFDFTAASHFGIGLWIRNNWGLWAGSELSDYFNSMGVTHPDDMSGIILTSYYRHLKGEDINLEQQVERYQNFWEEIKRHVKQIEIDTAYRWQIKQSYDSLQAAKLNEKILKWSAGKKVSGYLDKRCDLIKDCLLRTRVDGDIIGWSNDTLTIKVTKYYDERLKRKLTKCYNISNDTLVVPDHELFTLEE